MKKSIYLDYASTTPVDPRVLKTMLPYLKEKFGNTMSIYRAGQEAKLALEKSREAVAGLIGARAREIVFTGSATESNNLALKGVAFANAKRGKNIVISAIEHPSVLEPALWLEKQGFALTVLPVDKTGQVNPQNVQKAIKKDTILVSVIHSSNEIGSVQPIKEIGRICRKKGVYFHTDAAQSFGKISINVEKANIDMLTASSHKIYGPKGAACLFVRDGVKIEPILHGGGQETGLRSSTVNVPAIVGFGEAARICQAEMRKEAEKTIKTRDEIIKNVLNIKGAHLTGNPEKRLPNNASFWFEEIEGDSVVIKMDLEGVSVSTGSACSTLKMEPSPVLLAVGLKRKEAGGSLRVTLGRWTTEKEIEQFLKILRKAITELRDIG